jgi:hypothetical protein
MLDYTSETMLISVLQCGVRYIDITIFASDYSDNAIPVVASGYRQGQWKLTLNTIPFDDFLRTLKSTIYTTLAGSGHTGVSNPDDPFFIGLNLAVGINLKCLNRIARTIMTHFGDNLLPGKYSYQSVDTIPEIPMNKLIKKFVIFSSTGFEGSKLEELVNYSWDNTAHNPDHTLKRVTASIVIKNRAEMRDYNRDIGMTIVVPSDDGAFYSDNYDIAPYVDVGCQFIAMNWQTIDDNIDPVVTKFKRRGIILKNYRKPLQNGKNE